MADDQRPDLGTGALGKWCALSPAEAHLTGEVLRSALGEAEQELSELLDCGVGRPRALGHGADREFESFPSAKISR
jgi:hypothetical protein